MQTIEWSRPGKWLAARLRFQTALAALGAGLAFGLLAYGSIELTRADGRIATVWIPNALAVAILLRVRSPGEWVILAAMWLGNGSAGLAVGDTPLTAFGLASCNLAEITVALTFMRRFGSGRADMTSMGDLARFVGLAGVLAPLVSASLAALVLAGNGSALPDTWLDWFLADGLGMIVFAPATMIFLDALAKPRWPSRSEAAEWLLLTLLGTSLTVFVFWQTRYPLLFLLPPIVLIHAFRLGSLGTAFSVVKVATVATLLTWMERGPFNLVSHSFSSDIILLQGFLASSFFIGLPVAAVLNDQRRLAQALRDRARQLRLLADNITDAILTYDTEGRCNYASPSTREVLGDDAAAFLGRRASDRMHEDARNAIAEAERRLLSGETEKERLTYRRYLDDEYGEAAYIEADAAIARNHETGVPEGIVVSARNVTERVRLEHQLVRARRHAENASLAKAQFLANMSHEIRTPMNGVLGFAQLLLQSGLEDEQRRHAELIEESGKSMMRLLNDILDISKIEAGHIAVQNEPVSIRHLLTTCIKLHSANAAQKGIDLAHACAPDVPELIVCDALRLRQIVLNLLGNAIKFTERGAVSVEARSDGEAIEIAVEDSGIGIASDRIEQVFNPFEQADNATSRRYGGTGLGLAISRQLAELLGGSLKATSEEGRGSRFVLRVPVRLPDTASEPHAVPLTDPAQASLPPQARILLAEDHDINRILVTSMLERCGQEVETVEDGNKAVAAAITAAREGRPFDLVLMDVQMPRCDGYAATRALRLAGLDASQLPIVALTANAFEEDVRAALDAGMQAHLAKPLAYDDLVKALARWLPTRIVDEQANAATAAPASPCAPELSRKWLERRSEALMAVGEALRSGMLEGAEAGELARLVHKLAGTAGMFGEEELGRRAAAFERALRSGQPGDIREQLAEELLQAA